MRKKRASTITELKNLQQLHPKSKLKAKPQDCVNIICTGWLALFILPPHI